MRDIADTRGDESLDFRLGIYSWPVAFIAIIVSAILSQKIIFILVICAFIICQLIQIGLIIWKMKPNGGLKYTFICAIVYLLGSLSTLLILILSLMILCIILLLFIVLFYCLCFFLSALNATNRLAIYEIYVSQNYECADFVYDSGE